ncbi:MAG: NYN domain-containing protein [Candidatus Taylorbacteria bacterium]|nr:NYN domain-containing protein [Candidatus Taylorbacteria bacterium]
MFIPISERLKELATAYPERIQELKKIFDKKTNVYIDYANVRPWSQKLGWHVDLRRLKQFLNSFNTIKEVKLYSGTLKGNSQSKMVIKEAQRLGYVVKTKPVKIMKLSIDTTSINSSSLDLLKDFIRKPLLEKLRIETIESLNNELKLLNQQGIFYIEDLKSNFDVEIGRDMLRDYDTEDLDSFILWSGDSDFEDPIRQLLNDKKKVMLFATARRVATELNDLRTNGLAIFDIQKIKEFICYKKEMTAVPDTAKGTSFEAPKL